MTTSENDSNSVDRITQECRYCANTGWFYGDKDLNILCGCQFGEIRAEYVYGCEIVSTHSGVCKHGTKSCVVNHG